MLLTSTRRKLKPTKPILNHSIDWFATILELAQAKNTPKNIDGISLAKTVFKPELSDEESKIRDRLIVGVFHNFARTRKGETLDHCVLQLTLHETGLKFCTNNQFLEWNVQYAVIYKGYKFFNSEAEPGKRAKAGFPKNYLIL